MSISIKANKRQKVGPVFLAGMDIIEKWGKESIASSFSMVFDLAQQIN